MSYVADDYFYRKAGAGYILYQGRQAIWETATWAAMAEYLKANKIVASYRPVEIVVIY